MFTRKRKKEKNRLCSPVHPAPNTGARAYKHVLSHNLAWILNLKRSFFQRPFKDLRRLQFFKSFNVNNITMQSTTAYISTIKKKLFPFQKVPTVAVQSLVYKKKLQIKLPVGEILNYLHHNAANYTVKHLINAFTQRFYGPGTGN